MQTTEHILIEHMPFFLISIAITIPMMPSPSHFQASSAPGAKHYPLTTHFVLRIKSESGYARSARHVMM